MLPLRVVSRAVAPVAAARRCFHASAAVAMSGPPRLEGGERATKLASLPEWTEVSGRDAIQRTFLFDDFKQAWAFMNQVADVAEENDHHPEWFNVYNRVEVTLATHTCDGVSQNDIDLATKMEEFAATAAK